MRPARVTDSRYGIPNGLIMFQAVMVVGLGAEVMVEEGEEEEVVEEVVIGVRLIKGYYGNEVKIVKCTVNDIPVDISFNQTAGLSALCFLEKV
ncbi:hypothetical protein PVK06_044979 [Gossypium arboreum]|uniref:Uncharacterized protein n=1 Tax=Gossypium arboreum TaxID=29729 RepID=A0ABR0MSQ3_GOSAR|nr:hypothetical protein PVK06_044979 [Gossypium arboreum]